MPPRRLSIPMLAWMLLTGGCVRTRTVSVPIPVTAPPCVTARPPIPVADATPDQRADHYVALTSYAWSTYLACRQVDRGPALPPGETPPTEP